MFAKLEAELTVSKVGPFPTSMQYWYMFNLFWAWLIHLFYFGNIGFIKVFSWPIFCFILQMASFSNSFLCGTVSQVIYYSVT